MIIGIFDRLSSDNDDIPTRLNHRALQSQAFTKLSFDSIAYNCIAKTCTNDESEAAIRAIVGQEAQYNNSVTERFALSANLLESLVLPNSEFLLHIILIFNP